MPASHLARQLAYWTLPPGVQGLIRSSLSTGRAVLRGQHLWNARSLLERNAALKDRHRGERCFIIATGPSIKQQDLKRLRGEFCIAVSNAFVHPDYARIAPRYHCVAPMHSPYTDADALRWFRDMENKVGNATVLLSGSDKHLVDRYRLFQSQPVHYLLQDPQQDMEAPAANLTDLSRPLAPSQTVTQTALSLAIYLGFRTVYLLGTDHSWPLHIGTSVHFHDERERALGPEHWHVTDHATYFERFAMLLRKYKAIKAAAERAGCSIYNATPNSLLDVFPKQVFETLPLGPFGDPDLSETLE